MLHRLAVLPNLGDATVGECVTVGAGSTTANYDSANNHRKVIETDAHSDSNCVLVAPVIIGAGAYIGEGSTLAKDTPADKLCVARANRVEEAGEDG